MVVRNGRYWSLLVVATAASRFEVLRVHTAHDNHDQHSATISPVWLSGSARCILSFFIVSAQSVHFEKNEKFFHNFRKMKSAYLIYALLCVTLVLAVGELVNSKYWRVTIAKCVSYICVITKLKKHAISGGR